MRCFREAVGALRDLLAGDRGWTVMGSARGKEKIDSLAWQAANVSLTNIFQAFPARPVTTGGGDGMMGLGSELGSKFGSLNIGLLLNLPWEPRGHKDLSATLKSLSFSGRIPFFRAVSAVELFMVGGCGTLYEIFVLANANLKHLQTIANRNSSELRNASSEDLSKYRGSIHPMLATPFWKSTIDAFIREASGCKALEIGSVEDIGLSVAHTHEEFDRNALDVASKIFPETRVSPSIEERKRNLSFLSTEFVSAQNHIRDYYIWFNEFIGSLHAHPRVAFVGDGLVPEEEKNGIEQLMTRLFLEGTDVFLVGNAYGGLAKSAHKEARSLSERGHWQNSPLTSRQHTLKDFSIPSALGDPLSLGDPCIPAGLDIRELIGAMCCSVVSTVGGIETMTTLAHLIQHCQIGTNTAEKTGKPENRISPPHPAVMNLGYKQQIFLGGAIERVISIFHSSAVAVGTVAAGELRDSGVLCEKNIGQIIKGVMQSTNNYRITLASANIRPSSEWGKHPDVIVRGVASN